MAPKESKDQDELSKGKLVSKPKTSTNQQALHSLLEALRESKPKKKAKR